MPARRRPPGVRWGLDRRSGPVGSAFLVDVADDIVAIDCDSADRVEVVQEITTELQGHGYRPFGLLPVGPGHQHLFVPVVRRASSRAASNHGANFTVESRVCPRGQNPDTSLSKTTSDHATMNHTV